MMNAMIKKCSCLTTDTGLLILRIGVGAIFIMAGWMKVSNLHNTVAMFGSMGIGAFWAYLASFAELIGGIAVLLGIFARIGAILLTITMAVAVYMVHADMNMVMLPGILLFANLSLVFGGAGKYSLASKMCACGTCPMCADNTTAPKA
jgi:putative oxidoreductase